MRNSRLNQTAYSLYLFVRDVADGDLVGWIDAPLARGRSAADQGPLARQGPGTRSSLATSLSPRKAPKTAGGKPICIKRDGDMAEQLFRLGHDSKLQSADRRAASKMTFWKVNHPRFRGTLSKMCAGNSARSASNIADPELSSLLGFI